MMFQTVAACAENLHNVLKNHSLLQDPVDIKEIVSRFTTDIIGSCAFGIECNSLKNPNSEFRIYGKRNFDPKVFEIIKHIMTLLIPHEILRAVHLKQTNREVENFFIDAVRKTVEHREKNNIHRKDFMHLLLQLKNRGRLSDDEKLHIKNSGSDLNAEERLTMNEVAAQCFVFFLAGFETSGSTMTFALLELAMNQDIQEKLRHEIVSVLKKYGGNCTYEAIMEMKYLDQVVHGKFKEIHWYVPLSYFFIVSASLQSIF